MAGLSPRAKFYLKVSRALTEEEVKQLRETLVTDKHLSKAQVEKASPDEIFGALEAANKIGIGNMKILADLLRGLGKNKLAQEAEDVAKRGEHDYEAEDMDRRQMKGPSFAAHSNVGTSTYIMIFSLIVVLCGVYLQASHLNNMVEQNPVPQQPQVEMAGKDQDVQRLVDEMNQRIQELEDEMASKEEKFKTEVEQLKTEIQQQQDNLQRLNREDATKDHRIQTLEQRHYIEHCDSGVIDLRAKALTIDNPQMDVKETFRKDFNTEPVVTIGLTHVDHHPGHVRVNATIVSKSKKDMIVRFATWNTSILHKAMVHWMACA